MVNEPADEGGERLERRARALFEDSVERVDARTRSKLTQARHAALDEIRRSSSSPWRWLRSPASGLAAAALVAVLVVTWQAGDRGSEPTMPLDDFDIVADAESIDMLQDVEFYAWLDER